MKPPPNPMYELFWQCSTDDGHARLTIPAPDGSVRPSDAVELIEWLDLIIRRLRRYSVEHEATKTSENNRDALAAEAAEGGG